MINTSYVTMCEYLILYQVESTKSRLNAERQLMEFLSALKYYADKWSRAKFFA